VGYTIQYGPAGKAETAWHAKRRKKSGAVLAVCVLVIVFAVLALSGNFEQIKNYLIPGDPEVTKAAFAQFTEDIRQGDTVGDAITAFCREIIEGAEILQ